VYRDIVLLIPYDAQLHHGGMQWTSKIRTFYAIGFDQLCGIHDQRGWQFIPFSMRLIIRLTEVDVS
jgi:hypothetical protein